MLRNRRKPGSERRGALAATLLGFLAVGGAANAADVQILNHVSGGEQLSSIYFVGDVEQGDTQRIAQAIGEVVDSGRGLNAIYMYSKGGVAVEGVSMGRVLRAVHATVVGPYGAGDGPFQCEMPQAFSGQVLAAIQHNCTCASACAIAWLGGVYREGTAGFHRAHHTDGLTPAPHQREGTESVNRLFRDYVADMNGPNWLVDIIYQTNRKSLHFLTPEQQDVLRFDPIFEDYVLLVCGSTTGADNGACVHRARLDAFRQAYAKVLSDVQEEQTSRAEPGRFDRFDPDKPGYKRH